MHGVAWLFAQKESAGHGTHVPLCRNHPGSQIHASIALPTTASVAFGWHAVHEELPGLIWNESAGQSVHVSLELPTAVDSFPAGHSVHVAEPSSVLYVPVGHSAQPPNGPVAPGTHLQLVLNGVETLLSPQPLQAWSPVLFFHVVLEHGSHPASVLVYPTRQTHDRAPPTAGLDCAFAGHGSHAPAPAATLNVSGAQFSQAAGPGDSLYFPAAHALHRPPVSVRSPVKPALQVQFDTCVFAVESEKLLLGQSRHSWSPLCMNLPAAHAAQASPLGMYPASQTQSVDALLAAGEVEKLGHAVQAALSTTEPPAEYESAAHC